MCDVYLPLKFDSVFIISLSLMKDCSHVCDMSLQNNSNVSFAK